MRTSRTLSLVLLTAALIALTSASAFAQTLVTVPCTGTPTTDGLALRTAYNGIVGNSATSPYVVRPDPCLYDLGTATLTIRNFIDLIGLGRNDTIITSQVDRLTTPNTGTITVPAGVDAELANLTIRNEDTNQGYGVRNASSNYVMEDVIVETASLTDAVALYTVGRVRGIDLVLRAQTVGEEVEVARAVALEDVAGDSVVSSTLMTASGLACTDGFGAILNGSDATLDEVNIFVSACLNATGIDISGGSRPGINNTKATATSSGNGLTVGVDVSGASNVAQVGDTRLLVSGGTAYGVRNTSSTSSVLLTNVFADAQTGLTTVGLQVSAGLATADRSSLAGSTNSLVVSAGATGNIGVSRLNGPRSITGTATCVGVYDGAYAPIPPTC